MATYGYGRVSTAKQGRDGNSLEEQESKLKLNGATEVYLDCFTGTKEDRPKLNKLLGKLQSGDKVIVCKLDRLARNVRGGLDIIDKIVSKGCSLQILNMGLFDSSPIGKMMTTMMLAFAEFERDMIVERTTAGKEIAKQRDGYKDGRPSLEIDKAEVEKLRKKQKDGTMTIQECCDVLKISRSSWYNIIKAG